MSYTFNSPVYEPVTYMGSVPRVADVGSDQRIATVIRTVGPRGRV